MKLKEIKIGETYKHKFIGDVCIVDTSPFYCNSRHRGYYGAYPNNNKVSLSEKRTGSILASYYKNNIAYLSPVAVKPAELIGPVASIFIDSLKSILVEEYEKSISDTEEPAIVKALRILGLPNKHIVDGVDQYVTFTTAELINTARHKLTNCL